VNWILRRLIRSGLRRGLGREHWAWLLVAFAALAMRRARRRPDPVAFSLPISIGDRLLVSLSDPSRPGPPTDD
jgi:hypothetical protein